MTKVITISLFVGLVIMFITPLCAFSQQDPLDPYGPDSVLFELKCFYSEVSQESGRLIISVILENDQNLAHFLFPFQWTGPILPDSISYVGTRSQDMDFKQAIIDTVNQTLICQCVNVTGAIIEAGRGSVAELFFTTSDTGTITIDTTSTEEYVFYVTPEYAISWVPQFQKGVFHLERSVEILPGDVNLDQLVDLEDVIYLANYLLKGGPEPGYYPCSYANADMNGDCKINLADVIYLANYVLKGGPPPGSVSCVISETPLQPDQGGRK